MAKKLGLNRLIELQRFLCQFHLVERTVRHPQQFDRHETDTEHSYSLAMAAWLLAQYFPKLDKNVVIQIALVHDLVEVHAGDTFAYATDHTIIDKADREAAAIDKITKDWPDFPDMLHSIREYEARQTDEAKFVYALDKLMPIIMNYLNQGKTWRHDEITLEKLIAAKDTKIAISPEIYTYYQEILTMLQSHPEFFAPGVKSRKL